MSDVLMAPRDASGYDRPNLRSPKVVHVAIRWSAITFVSACSRVLLDETMAAPVDCWNIRARCRRRACRMRWDGP